MRRVLVVAALVVAVPIGGLIATAFALLGLGAAHAYVVPSSAMEPTLHCSRPGTGCEASHRDRLLALSWGVSFGRGDIVAFAAPPAAVERCGASGTYLKRVVGLPGETVQIRPIAGASYVFIDGRKLDEPYVKSSRRDQGPARAYRVPAGRYFLLGDNRASSCDSRFFGSVPEENLKSKVVLTYWPPGRISFR